MSLIDRTILEWAWMSEKGYPDLNNENDLKVFESMFGFKIQERKGENEAEIIKRLVSKFPNKYGTMSNPIRVANKEGVDNKEFVKDLKNVTDNTVEIQVTPPKTSPNPSGKFFFFQFNFEGNEIGIILASGGNKGNKFETVVANDLQKFIEGGKDFTYQSLIEKMIKEFKLTPTNFKIQEEGSRNQKRPLVFTPEGPVLGTPIKSDKQAQSVAETLTDITLIVNNKPIYISLKFGSTLTFFNPGVKKIFTEEDIKSGKINAAADPRLSIFRKLKDAGFKIKLKDIVPKKDYPLLEKD